MEINQVRFGNYSIGNSNTQKNQKGKEEESTNNQVELKQDKQTVSTDKVLDAMDLAGLQNKAEINIAKKTINPADYLSEERIGEIEAMMGNFEVGVEEIADSIEAEFPGMLSQEKKNELAASIYAAE